MMSRTVRYFKLMYIVAGILMSNEEVCETVDQIQITPRVEVNHLTQMYKKKCNSDKLNNKLCDNKGTIKHINNNGLRNFTNHITNSIVFKGLAAIAYKQLNTLKFRLLPRVTLTNLIDRLKSNFTPLFSSFNLWTIPNYLLDYSTNYISRRFFISSDCDMIYSR